MSSCTPLPPARDPCSVRFPGGIVIEGMSNIGDDDFDRGLALFRAMTPALAALAPVFAIIQAVLGIKKFVDAFTSFPPDPGLLAEAIDDVSTAAQKLIAVAPPVSVPLLIKDLLSCMITFLAGLIGRLREVQAFQQRIDEAKQKALEQDLPELDDLADCAEENVRLYLQHVSMTMGSFAALFGILQEMADLAGIGDLLPGVDFDAGEDLDGAIDKLNDVVRVLADILEAIP